MSVRTEADREMAKAREHIREARRILGELLNSGPRGEVGEVYGWDEYSDDFKEGTVLPNWLKLREIEKDL